MSKTEKKDILLAKSLWVDPSYPGEQLQLIGSRCKSCGEIYFPRKERQWCVHCQQSTLEDVKLGSNGKIASFSVIMVPPGGGYYKGSVPYAYGCVDLPVGVRVKALFATDNFDELKAGGDVELIVDKLGEDEEGNNVLTFKFKPILNLGKGRV